MTTITTAAAAESGTDADAFAERARALRPLLQANAAETNARRHVHPDNMAAMKQAGFYAIAQPARIGGRELDLRTLHRVTSELAQACPSTAWVLSVTSAHTWMLGMFPEACQDDIAADDPDTVISGALAAQGVARPTSGGWRLSGRWQFASGCDHARWNLIGARVEGDDPGLPKQIHVMAPTRDYAIDDTWHVLGLRGSGSKDLVLDDVFVPAHRAMSTGTLFSGRSPHAARHASALFLVPVAPGLAFHVCGPVLGVARGAWAAHVERTRGRGDRYTGGQKAQSVGQQMRIAEADMAIRAGAALMEQVADVFAAYGARRAIPDLETRAELKMMAAWAVRQCRQAVQLLYDAAGGGAAHDSQALQGFFRDMQVGSHHAMVDVDSAAETWGRVALGLPPGTTVL
jgi:3-hydroxy-9,10-secoandrosta-1,3,5(10)-triene-9,17-dione monooxygenase